MSIGYTVANGLHNHIGEVFAGDTYVVVRDINKSGLEADQLKLFVLHP